MSPTTEKEALPMVNVQVDGVWKKFPKGTRMIEACHQAGTEVPHYCYHPKLSSPGNCRMCLVEMGMPARPAPGQEPELDEQGFPKIQWIPRPAISCANTIAEGMGIRTNSPLAEECRKGVMELLLINHPLDCPICDQAGECRLQEFSVEHGNAQSRFLDVKVKKPKNVDVGPRVRLDDERCIMCSRCVRFCQEIAEDDCLGFTERGSHTVLATHPNKKLANNYSLNTVDICPVGALTSTDFRFQMRVWFLKETESICTGCGRGCNITIGSRNDKIHRLTPRENNEVNSTWMCDHGRLDFHYLHSERRLTEPLVKTGGTHRSTTWREAHQVAAACLKVLTPNQMAIVASGRMTNEELFMTRRLAVALGITQISIVPRSREADAFLVSADGNPNTLGAKLLLGVENPAQSLAEIRSGVESGAIKALLALGEDLTEVGFESRDLAKLDFLMSLHLVTNGTAAQAKIVFPRSGFAEKRGSMINVTGRLQRLNPAISPPGQAMDDWEIIRDLTKAITGDKGPSTLEEVFGQMAQDPPFAGLSLAKIGSVGVPLVETGEKVPLLEKERERIAKGIIVG